MNDNRPPARRPGKQAGEFAARLQHSREVMDRRRTIEREREHGVADAVRDYWLAWRAISAIERRRDRRVHALEEKIRHITDTADSDIDVHRQQQATAVVRLTEHGCSTDDVADLLEISLRTVRGLLSSGRAQSNPSEEKKQIPGN
ncbi:hypothetical protein [Nocardia nova]|uniref:hypothetical protein n=1 Tax=Nocardia nova TaxID=37330 RepID=UPI0033F7389B